MIAANLGWARVRPPGAHLLRRGAWYPVVNSRSSKLVVLQIERRNVAVLRHSVEMRDEKPDSFSVVKRAPFEPNPVRGSPLDLGPIYAVCPSSRARVRLTGHPSFMDCPVCCLEHAVAWEEDC